MQLSGDYYQRVLDNLYDGIYFVDQDKTIIYWNAGAERHTGYTRAEVMGRHCWENLMHVNEQGVRLCDGMCPLSQTIADGRLREVDVYIHHKEGHRVPVSLRIAPIHDSKGQIAIAVEIVSENSPKLTLRQKLEELQGLALLDPLTKLGNRRYIETSLLGRLEAMSRYGWPFGILFIDIDHFKNINDNYGHEMGDRVLNMVGKTMSNTLRSFDLLGRWGGEEFIAILMNVNNDQLCSIANRYRSLVEQSSISVGTDLVRVTVSIGATLAESTDTVGSLVGRADRLMYQSKKSGRNHISIHKSGLE
ncbi:MAG: GGDEF domain-containing protein [bacterium]